MAPPASASSPPSTIHAPSPTHAQGEGRPPTRILVVGSGGRENALAWALLRCPAVQTVWVTPGNGGSPAIEGCRQLGISESDSDALLDFGRKQEIDLVVIGPEAPLAAGVADRLRQGGLAVFGPGADGARLEASKDWAKALMREAGVATAGHWPAHSLQEALTVLERQGRPLVVKADGLAAGKGVTVAETLEECRAAIEAIFAGRDSVTATTDPETAPPALVLEERLSGPEVSVFALTDGQAMVLLPPAQDHKRIGEGDTGPNTGGMGAYAPAPLLDAAGLEQVRRTVLEPTLEALRARGISYRGVIYAGLMLTPAGPQVIEFNCRFGDPECQTLMPLMGPELAEVLLACARGDLTAAPPLSIDGRCSVCVVAAAHGYPGTVRSGDPIPPTPPADPSLQVFHAGTRARPDGTCVTAGGRVLSVVSQAKDFESAFEQAYAALAPIAFPGMIYRRDIGRQVRRLQALPTP